MIIAIEGPDRSGKSTLFEQLRRSLQWARFVPSLPMSPALFKHIAEVEARQACLWEALYDSRQCYICDRSLFVTGLVYDRIYGRPSMDIELWRPQIRVLYVEVPVEELQRRHAATGDPLFEADRYAEVIGVYNEIIQGFVHARIDGTHCEFVQRAIKQIYDWGFGPRGSVESADKHEVSDRRS